MELKDAINKLADTLNDSLRVWDDKDERDNLNTLYDWLTELESYRDQHDSEWHSYAAEKPPEKEQVLVIFEYFRYGDYNRIVKAVGLFTYPYEGFINGSSGWTNLRIIKWKHLNVRNEDIWNAR